MANVPSPIPETAGKENVLGSNCFIRLKFSFKSERIDEYSIS